ncbi:MAG: hypothetical protein GEV03_25675 [Streptosporangiales bacterium]|nr:hypothetical protein [Streptosporangiales bacterium]
MSQIWAMVGIMGAAFAAMIGLVFRAMSQHGRALTAEVGGLHHKIDAKIDGLRNEMTARFDHVSERIDGLSGRVDKLETRFERLETKVETLDRDVHSLTIRVMGTEPPREE